MGGVLPLFGAKMRQIQDTDLVGKKIKSIENNYVNLLKITFDDDSHVELWAEPAVYTAAGNIWGIFIEENSKPDAQDLDDCNDSKHHCHDECDDCTYGL